MMDRTETLGVDTPLRRALHRWYEAPTLRRLGGPMPAGSRVVEFGCGSGHGTGFAGVVSVISRTPTRRNCFGATTNPSPKPPGRCGLGGT